MNEEKGSVEAAVAAVFGGASALGFDLVSNPDGFILAVIYRAAVDGLQAFANESAYRLDQLLELFTDVVIGGLFHALGIPGRILGDTVLWVIDYVTGFATDLAASAGPVGFLVIPAMWGLVIVATVSLAVGTFEAYKWFRTVVV